MTALTINPSAPFAQRGVSQILSWQKATGTAIGQAPPEPFVKRQIMVPVDESRGTIVDTYV